jgi:hypothetical protein
MLSNHNPHIDNIAQKVAQKYWSEKSAYMVAQVLTIADRLSRVPRSMLSVLFGDTAHAKKAFFSSTRERAAARKLYFQVWFYAHIWWVILSEQTFDRYWNIWVLCLLIAFQWVSSRKLERTAKILLFQ